MTRILSVSIAKSLSSYETQTGNQQCWGWALGRGGRNGRFLGSTPPHSAEDVSVTFSTSMLESINASWDSCIRGAVAAINFWAGLYLPTLRHKRDALEVFVFSKLWFLAPNLPLPSGAALWITFAASLFCGGDTWRG